MVWQKNTCISTMVPNRNKNTQENFKFPLDYLPGFLVHASEVIYLSSVCLSYKTGLKSFLFCR